MKCDRLQESRVYQSRRRVIRNPLWNVDDLCLKIWCSRKFFMSLWRKSNIYQLQRSSCTGRKEEEGGSKCGTQRT